MSDQTFQLVLAGIAALLSLMSAGAVGLAGWCLLQVVAIKERLARQEERGEFVHQVLATIKSTITEVEGRIGKRLDGLSNKVTGLQERIERCPIRQAHSEGGK